MKKIIIILSIPFLIFLAGCGSEKTVNYKNEVTKSFAKLNTEPNFFLVIEKGPVDNYSLATTERINVKNTKASLTLFNAKKLKKEKVAGLVLLKAPPLKKINYSRDQFFSSLDKMVASLVEQTQGSIKKEVKVFKTSNYIVPVECLNNKNKVDNQSNQPRIETSSTDLNYFNPFAKKDRSLKDVTLIEFCYRQDNGLPQAFIFDSNNAVKSFSDPSVEEYPEALSITFDYPDRD